MVASTSIAALLFFIFSSKALQFTNDEHGDEEKKPETYRYMLSIFYFVQLDKAVVVPWHVFIIIIIIYQNNKNCLNAIGLHVVHLVSYKSANLSWITNQSLKITGKVYPASRGFLVALCSGG